MAWGKDLGLRSMKDVKTTLRLGLVWPRKHTHDSPVREDANFALLSAGIVRCRCFPQTVGLGAAVCTSFSLLLSFPQFSLLWRGIDFHARLGYRSVVQRSASRVIYIRSPFGCPCFRVFTRGVMRLESCYR